MNNYQELIGPDAIVQGETYSRTLEYLDSSGAPVNLTGCTARMMLRKGKEDVSPLLSLTTGSGITISALTGEVTVILTDSQTSALPIGRFWFDLELVFSGGQVVKLWRGYGEVLREITR